jgi:hypothetical protein
MPAEILLAGIHFSYGCPTSPNESFYFPFQGYYQQLFCLITFGFIPENNHNSATCKNKCFNKIAIQHF